jgi:hypothetical protein
MEVGTTDFRRNAWIGNLILDVWPEGAGGSSDSEAESSRVERKGYRRSTRAIRPHCEYVDEVRWDVMKRLDRQASAVSAIMRRTLLVHGI